MAKSKQEEPKRAPLTFFSKYPNYKILVNQDSHEKLPDGRVVYYGATYIKFKDGKYDPNWNDGVFNNSPTRKMNFLIEKIRTDKHISVDIDVIDEEKIKRDQDAQRKKMVDESPEMEALRKQNEQLKKQLFGKEDEKKEAKKATK